jgi:hypothetical protein
LGIALLLLFISVPIVEALRLRGFVGPAGSLWYFPVMNLILFGISVFLITQRRTIEVDSEARRMTLRRQSLYRTISFTASYEEIDKLTLRAHSRARSSSSEIRSGLQRICDRRLHRRPKLPDTGSTLDA